VRPEIPAFAAASGSQASLEPSTDTLTVDGIAFTYPDSTDGTFDEGVAQQDAGWGTTHELGNLYSVGLNNESDVDSTIAVTTVPF